VAKAPVPGPAKTRIGQQVGHERAAEVAAASLLDTLATATAVGWPVVVALTGDLRVATRGDEIEAALAPTQVVPQRGESFGERLVQAHRDADAGHGVVQVGMDSPQATVADYRQAGRDLAEGATVLGPASDGGWWLLGVTEASRAAVLDSVPMSQADTAARTAAAVGGDVRWLRTLTDMDSWDDAVSIAAALTGSHLAAAVARSAA